MSNNNDIRHRFEQAFMPNYGVPPVALARGEGTRVWDVDGRQYLDFVGGIAVSSLGHAHPALVEAVSRQVATIAHTSNLFLHEPEVLLAERLLGLLGAPGRVFLANSGTEANEAAYKLALKYGRREGRGYFVAAENGFHGRTIGALSLTGKQSIRDQFGPFPVDVRFVPYGDASALKEAVSGDCIAVFLEPTQGEAGVVPPPDGYLVAAREICDATGALLVADEIQSAIGRTGHWFAHQADGFLPDILTLAKGLGGGLPIGACIGFGEAGTLFDKGDHGSTFGGNPVACAAALAVLDHLDLDHVKAAGARLRSGLEAIDHPLLKGVRGRGLWLATVLSEPRSAEVQRAAAAAGFLVNALQPDAVRLAPPLVVTDGEIDALVAAFPAILTEAAQ
ncbi:acetylornithine transaminase [Nonomuraea cavernae]|uniref:Acetylornithine aminotransferase n=1 Tax=Nonomuraea cavernae TaxID=2045107 RepID=A0A917Z1F2_9ACTN|nr:acetylornithine transaminase [Nonomuraea cavernae]MCA2187972.1 acetylornithine transaminase [Nonomuraea cavernae]GGO72422.1 acetylornithine aminotransferase [Nonomuraea cavernae]